LDFVSERSLPRPEVRAAKLGPPGSASLTMETSLRLARTLQDRDNVQPDM
jgi:hypothetical protein